MKNHLILIGVFYYYFRRGVVFPTDQETQVNDKLHFLILNVLSVQNKTMTLYNPQAKKQARFLIY